MAHSNEQIVTAWAGLIRNAIAINQPPIADDVPFPVLRVYHAYQLIKAMDGAYLSTENLMPLYREKVPTDTSAFETIRMCFSWLAKLFPDDIESSPRTGTGYRYRRGSIQPKIVSKQMLPSKPKASLAEEKRVSIRDKLNERMRQLSA
jgi:hypothetical protein